MNAHTPPRYVFAFACTFLEFIDVTDDVTADESEDSVKTLLLNEVDGISSMKKLKLYIMRC